MDKNITNKLRVIGTPQDIAKFESLITPYNNLEGFQEPHVRKIIQDIQDTPDNKLSQLTILYSGNTVWSKVKLVNAVRKIVKAQNMNAMTRYLYEFLSCSCGSIAHYNQQGWIDTYPTVDSLKEFFKRNEFGERVINHLPHWKVDAINAVHDIEKILKV